jgi:hypothetical protein
MNRFERIEMSGRRCGRLTVIRPVRNDGRGFTWFCRCDCGREVVRLGGLLRDGRTQSCGCYRRERISARKRTHNDSGYNSKRSPLYEIWSGMHQRCTNQKKKNYKNYGGRGIRVCERWSSYEHFKEDMGSGFRPGLSLDRIDNAGNYEPTNCRWATRKQQSRNQRTNRLITFQGATRTAAEWAEILGVPHKRFLDRIDRLGWPVDRAMQEPARGWCPGRALAERLENPPAIPIPGLPPA